MEKEETTENTVTCTGETERKYYIKTDATWEFVYQYLYFIRPRAMDDDKFYEMYTKMMDYVDSKIAIHDSEIIKEYNLFEVKLGKLEEEYANITTETVNWVEE